MALYIHHIYIIHCIRIYTLYDVYTRVRRYARASVVYAYLAEEVILSLPRMLYCRRTHTTTQ